MKSRVTIVRFCLPFLMLASCAVAPAQSAPAQSAPATATLRPIPTATRQPPTETPGPTAVPVPTLGPGFARLGDGPIITLGAPGAWDYPYTDPGAVAFHNGRFHMIRNGFQGWPAAVDWGYASSADGATWNKGADDMPILRSRDVPYAKLAALASSLLVETDNTWVLYFYTWENGSYPSAGGIGRATARNPQGPWTPDKDLVLKPGAQGAWDSQHVLAPNVLSTADGYVMYYAGYGPSGQQQIGRATSKDGIAWIKYDDPSTAAAPYAESDPVLKAGPSGAWDADWVHQPRVFNTGRGWLMIYRGTPAPRSQTMSLGMATSVDGVVWTRAQDNPVLSPADIAGTRQFWWTNGLAREGVLYLFVEGDLGGKTQIYLLTRKI